MKIKYYGTGAGAGIPELFCSCRVCAYARKNGGKDFRTRSQAVVGDLMIDFPVDAHAHALFYGIDMQEYRDVLITHDHPDHFSRLEINSRFQDDGEWRFYLPPDSAEPERKRQAAILASNKQIPPRRAVTVLDAAPFETMTIQGYHVTALPANHVKNLQCVLYLIEKDGKTVFWAHDTGLLPEETVEYFRKRKVHLNAVSLDCTLKRGDPITPAHMDILQCKQTADMLRSFGCIDDSTVIILSHFGHLVERTHQELVEEAVEFGMIPAFNGMEIEI